MKAVPAAPKRKADPSLSVDPLVLRYHNPRRNLNFERRILSSLRHSNRELWQAMTATTVWLRLGRILPFPKTERVRIPPHQDPNLEVKL